MRWPILRMSLKLHIGMGVLIFYRNLMITLLSKNLLTLRTLSRHLSLDSSLTSAPVYLVRNWMKVPELFMWLLIQHIIWCHRLLILFFSPPGVLVCVFSVVASQGGYARWSLTALCVIVAICLVLIIIIWRQPQSKTNLAFKVSVCPFAKGFSHAISYPHSSVSLSPLEINNQ